MTDINETIATAAKPQQTRRPRKMAREPKAGDAPAAAAADASPSPKRESKAEQVLHMLQRREGATIDQLVAATGWLPHTTRAALTGLRKKGHAITSDKLEGRGRVYRVAAA